MRTVAVTWRSYCTRLTVIAELAQRVPERSLPVTLTSTASALAMLMTLSTIALTSSRVYMRGLWGKKQNPTPNFFWGGFWGVLEEKRGGGDGA